MTWRREQRDSDINGLELLIRSAVRRFDEHDSRELRSRRERATRFPLAGELQDALADGFADRLVGRDGGEPGGLRLVLVTQKVNQPLAAGVRDRATHGDSSSISSGVKSCWDRCRIVRTTTAWGRITNKARCDFFLPTP